MLRFSIFLGIFGASLGANYGDLRVKFGWSEALADKDHFFKVPRTLAEAEGAGWRRTERPPGLMPELRLHCAPGRMLCALYDPSGFVAGLQIGLPVNEFESPSIKPEKKFIKWRSTADESEPARDFWTATQYFVSEESLKAGAGPRQENGATLQDGGVWVADNSGKLIEIPISEAELNSTLFKKQNCIPNMGIHYYYNMTAELSCEEVLPWFALTSEGALVGTGMQMFGRLPAPAQGRDWFERPPARAAQITIPFAPTCLNEWASSYGVISLHIYYVEAPWRIRCAAGDSAQPAPALDRLLLNGQRYASQVFDEIKSIFTG